MNIQINYGNNEVKHMKERMDELIDYINKASYEYYVLDNPTITDQEYDDYYNELLSIEEKYPELKEKIPQQIELEELF